MVRLLDIVEFLDKYLGVRNFTSVDIVVNGLEIEGRDDVRKAVFAVSLTRQIVDRAVECDADAIFLHHGILTRGTRGAELPCDIIRGGLRQILRLILAHEISVLAYHLPLDAHPEIGNNVTIASMLGLKNLEWIPEDKCPPIGVIGLLDPPRPAEDVLNTVREKINPRALLLRHGPETVRKVAVVSGAGGDYIRRFRQGEIDLLITGEIKEQHEVYAINEGINVIVAGHYHTEIFGIRNLSKLVRDRFGVETLFVESSQTV